MSLKKKPRLAFILLFVVLVSGVLGAVTDLLLFIYIEIASAVAVLMVAFFGLLLPTILTFFEASRKSKHQDREELEKW